MIYLILGVGLSLGIVWFVYRILYPRDPIYIKEKKHE